MNREQKAAEVEGLKQRFSHAQAVFLANYKGLTVANVTDLRSKLRAKSAGMKVLKNRLARIAVKGTPHEILSASFKETVALITATGDPTSAAKVLKGFAKDNEKLEIKSGYLDGKIISVQEVNALADMPSREQLIAKMLGSLNAPATNLVSVLIQIPRQWARVLAAVRDQKAKEA